MAALHDVKPQWVLVNGMLHNVSDFAHLLPKQRPYATCPICQQSVTLKLGAERVHHYAHDKDLGCSASYSETALHLNTKFHFYHQLLNTNTLYVAQSCSGHCGASQNHVWLRGWTSVQVEYTVDSFRPDLALLYNGYVGGAIEIRVTHAVGVEKAEYFAQNNIVWLEIAAHEALYQGDAVWTAHDPLPVNQYALDLERWVCNDCQEQQRRLQERQAYEQSNYEGIHAAKMVDFYFRSGKKYREVYYVMKQVRNNEWVRAWVKTEQNEILAVENGSITQESLRRLHNAVVERCADRQRKGAIVDNFMDWRKWIKGQKFVARDVDRFPFNFVWNEQQHTWQERGLTNRWKRRA